MHNDLDENMDHILDKKNSNNNNILYFIILLILQAYKLIKIHWNL